MLYKMIRARRRKSLTNYKKRVAQVKSGMLRLVVRKSNRAVTMQIVEYNESGDRVLVSSNSNDLKKLGWEPKRNIPTAYLTGLLLAKKSKAHNKNITLDIGLYRPIKGSLIFAAAKGSKDGGLNILGNIEVDSKRISGVHIAEYANSIKDEKEFKRQFSSYMDLKFDVKKINEKFEAVKKQIMSM